MTGQQELGGAFVTLYEQLRSVARARLAGVNGTSLQATALVHEALLRLSGRRLDSFADEHHLLAAAAQAIRHSIVDHLRQKRALKRNLGLTVSASERSSDSHGSGEGGLDAMLERCGPEHADLAIDLDQALGELADVDPELRVIVELYVFGGIPLVEIAALTGSTERTVRRRWQFAASLLRQKLDAWKRDGRDPPV